MAASKYLPWRRWIGFGVAALFSIAVHAADATTVSTEAKSCPPPTPMPSTPELQALAREATDHGFLWRIERDGRTSWLYGTIHVGNPPLAMPGPQVRAALRNSQVVALELDVLDPEVVKQTAQEFAPGDARVPARLTARMNALLASVCLPAEVAAKLHPIMQLTVADLEAQKRQGFYAEYAADFVVAGMGKALGKRVVSLETAREQADALIGPDRKVDEVALAEGLDDALSGKSAAEIKRLMTMWADNDRDRLSRFFEWCDCNNTAREKLEWKRLLDERNPRMAERIDRLHAAGDRVFAAVGSLHMVGTNGLPALLAARGYTVTAVPLRGAGVSPPTDAPKLDK